MGQEDSSQRCLARPPALHPGALREEQRPEVGMPDALGARALDARRLGVAVFECPCSVGALLRRSGQTAQEDNLLWARQSLVLLRGWWPQREIVAVADSAYASLRLLASCRRFLPRPVTFVTRLRLDAALYDPAPPRRAGQIGRPRLKGERLPNLSVIAEDPSTTWTPTIVNDWYGGGERSVEVASATALW